MIYYSVYLSEEANSESCEMSKMIFFAKITDDWTLLTIFAKKSFLDAWQDCEYVSAQCLYPIKIQKSTDQKKKSLTPILRRLYNWIVNELPHHLCLWHSKHKCHDFFHQQQWILGNEEMFEKINQQLLWNQKPKRVNLLVCWNIFGNSCS